MTPRLVSTVLALAVLASASVEAGRVKRQFLLQFDVCPETHPHAFDGGKKCCKTVKKFNSEFWPSADGCADDDEVTCPATKCEDGKLPCVADPCTCRYSIGVKDVSELYDGDYEFDFYGGFVEAGRPVYQNEDESKCVWWHYGSRRWWVGPCDDVGTNSGFAYLDDDLTCPFSKDETTWKRGGTDEAIPGAAVSWQGYVNEDDDGDDEEEEKDKDEEAEGKVVKDYPELKDPEDQLITVGTNAIIRNGKYTQWCRIVDKTFGCPQK